MSAKIPATNSPYYSTLVGNVIFTIGAENTNAIAVTIQLKDHNGNDLTVRACLPWYLSDDANGDSIAASAPSSGIAIGTDGLLIEYIADKAGMVTSESDGDIDVVITEATAKSFWLVLVLPDGSLKVSSAITFA